MGNQNKACGFTYMGVLITITLISMSMAATGTLWKKTVMSEKEKQLLYVGDAFARAIESYYINSPDGIKTLPKSVNDLLLDKRFATIKRHLRKLYLDPMTASTDWGFIYKGQYLIGVYSKSQRQPIKKANFEPQYSYFTYATNYQDWKFIPEYMREADSTR
jgi:type II secretory pathway pseudopilin PulG